MRKIALSFLAVAAMSNLGFAGGDIAPIEPEVIVPVVVEADNSSFYVGLGLAAVSTRDSNGDMSFFDEEIGQDRLTNVSLLAGYNYNEYIAVEGRYTTSVSDEDQVEMSGWSLFLKPQYPVTEDFSVYALLGFGGVILDGIDGHFTDVDDSGFQWGLGASYMVMDNLSLFVDYTSLAVEMEGTFFNGAREIDTDAITLGVTYSF